MSRSHARGEAAASGASPWLAAWLAAHPKGRVSAKEVSEAAAAGDRVAQELIDHALLAISRAVAGFVNVFNPSRIIIGGSFAEAHWMALHSRIEGRSATIASRFQDGEFPCTPPNSVGT